MSYTNRRELGIFKDTLENNCEEEAISVLPCSFLTHEVRSGFSLGKLIEVAELQHLWIFLNSPTQDISDSMIFLSDAYNYMNTDILGAQFVSILGELAFFW